MLSSEDTTKSASIVKKMKDFWELKASKASDEIIVSKSTRNGKLQDASISCAVKAITIQQKHVIHQVELTCSCCSSVFIVRAAHDCSNDSQTCFPHGGDDDDDASEETGLEWLGANGEQQQINLTI